MSIAPAKAEIQVIDAQPSGQPRAHDSRWIVRCKVHRVLSGLFPEEQSTISLLVHSPTKTFRTAADDLALYVFTVEFTGPVTDPYDGDLAVLASRKL